MKVKNLQEFLRGAHGGFMAALADAYTKADSHNAKRILEAFPDKFEIEHEPAIYGGRESFELNAPRKAYYWHRAPNSEPTMCYKGEKNELRMIFGLVEWDRINEKSVFYGPVYAPKDL